VEASALIRNGAGQTIGAFVIATLPRRSDNLEMHESTVEVVEGGTYRFDVRLDEHPSSVVLEPGDELFSFDSMACLQGRFLPQQHVGRLRIAITAPSSGTAGVVEIEVAPAKLEYESEYRHMLGDIAEVATEALLQGFAPASLTLAQDSSTPSSLLYQQFAFLSARVRSREVQDALALILASPHRAWETQIELQSVARPLPGTSRLSRAVSKPGSRVRTNGRLRVASVPRMIERGRTEATLDSVPNRFVKYALERWRTIAQQLLDALGESDGTGPGPQRRGRRIAREMQEQIDHVLAAPLFAEVGELDVFPSANQVLHKQPGYREIFQTFALAEVGASLSLDLAVDDLFSATQRNVATLYEYWAFLQLVDAVGAACGERRTVEALARSSDGLSLGFRQGTKSGVSWDTAAGGRRLTVEVFFNRHFRSSTDASRASSWSRAMRPDCSVRIRPQTGLPEGQPGSLDVWLHFDAKYRVERAREQFDATTEESDEAASDAEATERMSRSKREDLLKMHAYRDAIRGSAGAYVLFPGDDGGPPFREFAEPLPGLGAFPLRPTGGARARGGQVLESFLREVLDHVADRASQDERYRYWRAVVRGRPEIGSEGRSLPPLLTPPRDAVVLCGVVRSRAAWEWICGTLVYVLAADSASDGMTATAAELRAEWVVLASADTPSRLWAREGAWYLQTREDLAAELRYPEPEEAAYVCTGLRPVRDAPAWLPSLDLAKIQRGGGSTRRDVAVATWADLLEAATGD
jgi:predicted component of viral defense system (DUF524 family)